MNIPLPSAVSGGHVFQAVDAGTNAGCGLTTANVLRCWGDNSWESTGTGNSRTTPFPVSGGHSWKSVSVGGSIGCGIRTDDTAMCWGRSDTGALGNGITSPDTSALPVQVGAAEAGCVLGAASSSAAYDHIDMKDIIFANGQFSVLGYDGANDMVMNSPDGITWSTVNIGPAYGNFAYGNGIYVAIQSWWWGNTMTSTDGVNWTIHSGAIPFATYSDINYGNGVFIAAGDDGMTTSTDGIVWSPMASHGPAAPPARPDTWRPSSTRTGDL